jgi:hypothetical protein
VCVLRGGVRERLGQGGGRGLQLLRRLQLL